MRSTSVSAPSHPHPTPPPQNTCVAKTETGLCHGILPFYRRSGRLLKKYLSVMGSTGSGVSQSKACMAKWCKVLIRNMCADSPASCPKRRPPCRLPAVTNHLPNSAAISAWLLWNVVLNLDSEERLFVNGWRESRRDADFWAGGAEKTCPPSKCRCLWCFTPHTCSKVLPGTKSACSTNCTTFLPSNAAQTPDCVRTDAYPHVGTGPFPAQHA